MLQTLRNQRSPLIIHFRPESWKQRWIRGPISGTVWVRWINERKGLLGFRFHIRKRRSRTWSSDLTDLDTGHSLRHTPGEFIASDQELLWAVSRRCQQSRARYQRFLRHEDRPQWQPRKHPRFSRRGNQNSRWHQDYRRLWMCAGGSWCPDWNLDQGLSGFSSRG